MTESTTVTALVATGSATAEGALRNIWLADADVDTVLGGRIYPMYAPQSSVMPYTVYHRIDATHEHHFTAGAGLTVVRIQVDTYGTDYGDLMALRNYMRIAADGYTGTVAAGGGNITIKMCHLDQDNLGVTGPLDGSDNPVYKISQDWKVGHAESVPTF